MAPIKPSPKPTVALSSKPASSTLSSHPTKSAHTPKPSKRTKRHSKHTTLLSHLTKPSPQSSKVHKRRRPGKKLAVNLDALGDALEGVVGGTATADQNISGDRQGEEARQRNPYGVNGGKISHKSMKSQPGAMKKREKVAAMERERFARNLAEMMAGGEQRGGGGVVQDGEGGEGGGERGMMVVDSEGGGEAGGGGINESMKGPGSGGSTSKERWAAIRGFIGQTMERRGGGEGRV